MKELGIGVIGCGFMGKTQVETVTKFVKGATVKAVADVNEAAAQEVAAKYGIGWEKTVEALVARDDIDGVFIETPHFLHGEQALTAIRAGKHVMIEKPMAHTVELCDRIIEEGRRNGVLVSTVFSQRSRVCNLKAKELIDKGEIGKVRQLFEFHLLAGGLVKFPKWQSSRENLGILFGHAIHCLDRIRWLTGAEYATVYSKCFSLDPSAVVEGTTMALMTMTDGTTVSLWSSGELPPPPFPRREFSVMIVGEKGLMDVDAYGDLLINTSGKWEVAEKQPPVDWAGKGFLDPVRLQSFTRHAQGFIDAIHEHRQPPVTGWDGRQAVAAALAAYESAGSGREILLNK
ncbi:MAG: Gfo/Idh/MocA family oxidoreductase [Acidobacteriota bacterium]|nr:Gfo/Idh/MocA family oxidoreductase [Acidobacteriota bacterium]